MKAIVQTEYGSPDRLRLAEVDRPGVPDNGLLVSVQATAVHAGDWHLMRGSPFLLRLIFGGLLKPKTQILGTDMAGKIEAIGKDVTQFKVGDEVFGDLSESGFGGFAEYVCVAEKAVALKPRNVTFEAAAVVPVSALAALQALRDGGRVQPGQRVLITGASGGVGSFAVQMAKAFGAIVTGVCRTSKVEMVRSIGADEVIDYAHTDVTKTGVQYDLIIDTAAFRSVFDYLPVLKRGGRYVLVGGSMARIFQVMILGAVISKVVARRVMPLVSKPNQADLVVLKEMIEQGKVVPAIDRCYELCEVPEAIRQLEGREVRGKIAIRVAG